MKPYYWSTPLERCLDVEVQSRFLDDVSKRYVWFKFKLPRVSIFVEVLRREESKTDDKCHSDDDESFFCWFVSCEEDIIVNYSQDPAVTMQSQFSDSDKSPTCRRQRRIGPSHNLKTRAEIWMRRRYRVHFSNSHTHATQNNSRWDPPPTMVHFPSPPAPFLPRYRHRLHRRWPMHAPPPSRPSKFVLTCRKNEWFLVSICLKKWHGASFIVLYHISPPF